MSQERTDQRERFQGQYTALYEGIAVLVRDRAFAGDPDYMALWDGRSCFWCDVAVDPSRDGGDRTRTFDHIVTRGTGGGDEAANLRNCCSLCNHLRDQARPQEFRTTADSIVKPNRDDLLSMGQAFLDAGLVREARTVWTAAGQSRICSTMRIHDQIGALAFDASTKKGFEDIVSIQAAGHALACKGMATDDLVSILEASPGRSDLRRLRTVEAADLAARRDAVVRELKSRKRNMRPTSTGRAVSDGREVR